MPSVTLAANAAAPVPSVLVKLPLGQAAALALIIAAVPNRDGCYDRHHKLATASELT